MVSVHSAERQAGPQKMSRAKAKKCARIGCRQRLSQEFRLAECFCDALGAATKASKVGELIDARSVAVAPGETNGIVADALDVTNLQISSGAVFNRTSMPLAGGAWAKASKNLVGIFTEVAVGPLNLHDFGTVRRGDFYRGEHGTERKV